MPNSQLTECQELLTATQDALAEKQARIDTLEQVNEALRVSVWRRGSLLRRLMQTYVDPIYTLVLSEIRTELEE